MSDDFKYQCRRRSTRQHLEIKEAIVKAEEFGAGSGGDDGDGNNYHHYDGWYTVNAQEVSLVAEDPTNPVIDLLAASESTNGIVNVRGSKGVRITTGPPGQPPYNNMNVFGLEVQTGDSQYIALIRGMEENPSQGVVLLNDQGVGINGNQGGVWLRSKTKIKLMVIGGTSYIELTPSGIVMKGPLIQIN
jgi:hypothetical protein